MLPGLPFTSLFCPPLGFGHKAVLQQPSPGSSSGKQQLGKELSCNSCCRAAVPMGWGLILPCSGCFHRMAPSRLLFSHFSSFSQSSALSCLSGCPWRASWDTRSCWAGPWQVAGGRQPLSLCPRQRAWAVGEQLGLPGALGMLFLPCLLFFNPPCYQRFFLWNSHPAAGLLGGEQREAEAPGMPSPVTNNAVIDLPLFTARPRWALPADPIV